MQQMHLKDNLPVFDAPKTQICSKFELYNETIPVVIKVNN